MPLHVSPTSVIEVVRSQLLDDRLNHFPAVIARASRAISDIERVYRGRRACLNVYDPDISNVHDTLRSALA